LDEVDESETGSAIFFGPAPARGSTSFWTYDRWQPPEQNAGDFVTSSVARRLGKPPVRYGDATEN
jgi:hypothetical protein